MQVTKNYTAHTDSKRRITLRGAKYQYYKVKEFDNGCMILEPQELKTPEGISDKTIKEMDQAVANFKEGKVSKPINLSDF